MIVSTKIIYFPDELNSGIIVRSQVSLQNTKFRFQISIDKR